MLEYGNTIGEKLAYYRLKNNLTQNELAKIVGLSSGSCIENFEKNKRLPGRDVSERLAQYFKLDTKYFFDEYLEDTYDFGSKLIMYRKQNNLSAKELASKLNISKSTLSMWERGGNHPNRYSYQKIKNQFLTQKQ